MLWLQSLNLDYAFWLTISAIFILLLLSAFFSGSETALTAASRGKLQTQADKGSRGAARALAITEDNERLIGSVLLGNNLVNILATALATALFTKLVGESSVALATLVMTVLVLIFAEVLPKTYAITNILICNNSTSAAATFDLHLVKNGRCGKIVLNVRDNGNGLIKIIKEI